MGQAHRFSGQGQPYEWLTTIRRGKVDWAGMARFVPEQLDVPLRRKKPTTYFVNSMSDLFHESLTNEAIFRVFAVMAATPWHTYQVLTKRPERALRAFEAVDLFRMGEYIREALPANGRSYPRTVDTWPLPNVHLGVSAEDQPTADKRIPLLLQCPAAVRWVSLEPLLGPVSFRLTTHNIGSTSRHLNALTGEGIEYSGDGGAGMWKEPTKLDWAVAGSESGPRARPMHLEWIESLRDQCAAAGVPFFTKQIANAHDKKGGDPRHWPGGPWPREFPERGDGAG